MKLKKMALATMLILGSLSSYSRTLTIVNTTYPNYEIHAECTDQECEEINVNYFKDSKEFERSVISREKITKNMKVKTPKDGGFNPEFYNITKGSVAEVKRSLNEGYYGDAVGFTLGTSVSILVDTVILPFELVGKSVGKLGDILNENETEEHYKWIRKGSERFLRNLDSDQVEMRVKQKYWVEMVTALKASTIRPQSK